MNINRNIDVKISHRSMLAITGIIGVVWFCFLYGFECVDFTNVNWIYNSYNDIVSHYIGWVYYRNSDWSFPLGIFSGLTGAYNNSIVYLDSIPLFALAFKLFRWALPDTFQYLGFFSLLSVVLQGMCGSELVYRLTGKVNESILSSFFFLSATVLSRRLFDHTSLTFHAIILLALILFFENREEKKKHIFLKWNGLLFLAVMIHAYYVPMIFALELFYYIKVSKLKDAASIIGKILVSMGFAVALMYAIGYFESASYTVDNDTLGYFGTSLNAFFYGQGFSFVDVALGNASKVWELEEGYAYLGAGAIVLVIIALAYYFKNWKEKSNKKTDILVIILFSIFMIVSMFPTIRWNWDKAIFIPVPNLLRKILGIFRSNGRFIWPAFYLVILGACVVLIRMAGHAKAIICACLLVQVIDLLPYYAMQAETIKGREHEAYCSEMMSNIPEGYDYVMLMSEPNCDSGFGFDATCKLGNFAVDRQAALSDFYMARKREVELANDRSNVWSEISRGEIDDKCIYVFASVPYRIMINTNALHYYAFDGVICALAGEVEGANELNINNGINMLAFNEYVDIDIVKSSGEVREKSTEPISLVPGHILYKEVILPEGIFRIEIMGKGLDSKCIIVEGENCGVDILDADSEHIAVQLIVTGEDAKVKIQCDNISDENIYVDAINIYY